ncbi:MAG: sodium:proton antiporter [Gemmataceae bacterium]|nr:sodium:proton antiporter [Gemmataceae bacterium]
MPIFAAALPPLDVPMAAAGPFTLFLAAIAVLPLAAGHWWHANRNKGIVSAAIGLPIAVFLLLQPHGAAHLAHALEEYVSFIVLLGALYIIAGGIVVTGDLEAKPRVNVAFLALGAVLASVIGTTGASMVLIRPVLRTNSERRNVAHIPIFFIFIVSNCGGLLTPLGDPPLFLGFLKGVDFFWTARLWPQWLFVNGALLAIFFVWDRRAYAREKPGDIRRDIRDVIPLKVRGLRLNGPLLLGVVAAVLAKKFVPVFPVSELAMVLLAAISLRKTPRTNRELNKFAWGPIVEVAVLFAGIFVAMVPALALLHKHGAALGVTQPWQFFWITGGLSSVLDNAPTYVTMGELAVVVGGLNEFRELPAAMPAILSAISCGAVFLGAMTYIGNGPNFMVKAIAEESGYKMPSFFGYLGLAALVLLPVFLGVAAIGFR